jgi:hypothetical protein
MYDHDVTTTVRQSLQDVHLDVPVADIVQRGAALRARRARLGVVAATVAMALIAVTSAALLAAAGSTAGHPRSGHHATLTAWTVSETSNGPVAVTIRQLTDFVGLEAKLQTYGIPSIVTPSLALPPSCVEWHAGDYTTRSIITLANESGLPDAGGVEFTIQPGAIPQGALLWLGLAQAGAPADSTGPAGPMSIGLFDDTAACSGAGSL